MTVRRLFGRGDDGPRESLSHLRRVAVVGESRYQPALSAIAGGARRESQRITTNALARREPDNAFDANAVQVFIAARLIGYLPRHEAAVYARLMDERGIEGIPCHAEIRGGWDNGEDRGDFGVVVWLPRPDTLREE